MATDTRLNPHAGNWEGGYTDRHGQHWVHVPWQGWQPAAPTPYLVGPPRRRWRRLRRAAIYLAKAAAIAAALYCVVMLAGTILGTLAGILITEWSRR